MKYTLQHSSPGPKAGLQKPEEQIKVIDQKKITHRQSGLNIRNEFLYSIWYFLLQVIINY